MNVYILDKNLNRLGLVNTFTDLVIKRYYTKPSEFEFHVKATDENFMLLKKDTIIYPKNNSDKEAGYIDYRKLSTDETGQEILVVTGYMLTKWLDRRIIWNQEVVNDTVEKAIRKLITNNAINCKDTNRNIPEIALGDIKNIGDVIEYQTSYKNLVEEIQLLCETYEIGFKSNLDMSNRKIIIDLYKGLDRTVNQSANPRCIFSRDFSNVLSQEYQESINNYRNTCLIAGDGEGIARKKTSIGNTNSGMNRFELFVDARDISDKETIKVTVPDYDEEGNVTGSHEEEREVEIPWSRYEPMLLERGKSKLAECKESQSLDVVIDITRDNVKYKRDFDLGDIVTVRDKKFGLQLDTRITEIHEVYSNSGYSINAVLGNNVPTLLDKIKSIVR